MIRQQPRKNANFASGDLSKDRKSLETSGRNRVKIDAMVRYSARGGVCEAESNIELPARVSTPAAADWDASVTVERINLWENTAKASRRKCELDQMRESPARS